MRRFKVTVTKEFECEVEIDDEALNAGSQDGDFLTAFRKGFYDYHEWHEHAEHIAREFMNETTFMEGYGIPYVDGQPQVFHKDDSEPTLNVKPLSGITYTSSMELLDPDENED